MATSGVAVWSCREERLATTDTHTHSAWGGRSLMASESEDKRTVRSDDAYEDAFPDEPKWPAWKVTLAVVVFCAACWAGIGYLAVRLLG